MKNYIVFDPSSGEILRSGACQDSVYEKLAQTDESVIEGVGSSATHYVDSVGNLAQYGDAAIVAKSAWPTYAASWSNEAFSWVDLRTSDQALSDQWSAVRSQRDALLAATDWRSLRANEQGGDLEPIWVDYRQALRDVTNQADPFHITWPESNEQ